MFRVEHFTLTLVQNIRNHDLLVIGQRPWRGQPIGRRGPAGIG